MIQDYEYTFYLLLNLKINEKNTSLLEINLSEIAIVKRIDWLLKTSTNFILHMNNLWNFIYKYVHILLLMFEISYHWCFISNND